VIFDRLGNEPEEADPGCSAAADLVAEDVATEGKRIASQKKRYHRVGGVIELLDSIREGKDNHRGISLTPGPIAWN